MNQTFARRFFRGASPIGRTLTVYAGTPRAMPLQIVGVAADNVTFSPRSPVRATWYMPLAQFQNGTLFDAARLSVRPKNGPPARLAGPVAAAVATVDSRLPLTSRLREQLKSPVADMKNTGERNGGAITAGLFLSEFTEGRRWLHVDLAGPAMAGKAYGLTTPGGTGFAVATILEFLSGNVRL